MSLPDEAGEYRHRNGNVAGRDQDRDAGREWAAPFLDFGMLQGQSLRRAPKAVIDVQAERDHAERVDEGDVPVAEAGYDVAVGCAMFELRMSAAGRQMKDVEDDEQQ